MRNYILKSCLVGIGLLLAHAVAAQEKQQMVRLARIVVDSTQLETYNNFLREEIETSMKIEKGVLFLYAVAEKKKPTHITILEIYKDEDAYQSHIKTPHFLKYKTATKDMIKSLEVLEGDPLIAGLLMK